MKTFTKYILQKILGFKTYLYIFSLFVIVKIRWDKKERDFFHFLSLLPAGGNVLDLGQILVLQVIICRVHCRKAPFFLLNLYR